MQIELSIEAERDIDNILDYTLVTFGPTQAEDYYLSLRGCFELIAENPEIGRTRPEVAPGLRSYSHRSHVIYYEVRDDHLLIVRVLHQRMDPARHMS